MLTQYANATLAPKPYAPFTFVKTRQGEVLEVMGSPCQIHTLSRGYVSVTDVRIPGESKTVKRILTEDIVGPAPKPEKMGTPDPEIEKLEKLRVQFETDLAAGKLTLAEELEGYIPTLIALSKAGRTVQELLIR